MEFKQWDGKNAKAHALTPEIWNQGFSQVNQSFLSGARDRTRAFGDHGFSQFKRVGSRVYSYAETPEVDSGSVRQPAGKLDSISA
nr:hypothetical protein [Tanacetum cinerariifolium]